MPNFTLCFSALCCLQVGISFRTSYTGITAAMEVNAESFGGGGVNLNLNLKKKKKRLLVLFCNFSLIRIANSSL